MERINIKSTVRNPAIEWIKLVSIIAIVFQHTVHANELAGVKTFTHGAVPIFAFISTYFATLSGFKTTSVWGLVWSRASHLYFLFLVWNTIYYAMRCLTQNVGAESSLRGFSWDSYLLSGYANAMWFLPFILVANVSGILIGHFTARISVAGLKAIAATLVVAALLAGLIPRGARIGPDLYFFSISVKAIPSVLLGLAFGLGFREWIRVVSRSSKVKLFSMISMFVSGVLLLTLGRVCYLFENVFGLSVMFIALALASPAIRLGVNPNLALWLFVSHPLFLHGLRKGMDFFGMNWDTSNWLVHVLGFACLIIVLVLAYRILMKVHFGPWLLRQPTTIDRKMLQTVET